MSYIGQPLKRMEDPRLITGSGSYLDDINLPNMLHASFLRSTHAHAVIKSVDTSKARAMPGVVAVLTWEDIAGAVKDIPAAHVELLGDVIVPEHPALAREKVYYVGQPVAVVVASDRQTARDALQEVEIDYEPLAPMIDPLKAVEGDSQPIHAWLGTNVMTRYSVGRGDLVAAFESADVVVSHSSHVPRLAPAPMEGRALLVHYERERGLLTAWSSTQAPFKLKSHLEKLLSLQGVKVRVVAPDVGGGFGQKVEVWAEDIALGYLAVKLGLPIKWVEDRWENMLSYQARGYWAEVEAACRADGVILGMRLRMVADVGAFALTSTTGTPINAANRFAGPYAIPNMEVEVLSVATNRPPSGPYRGAGAPEGAFFMERTIDLLALELGLDPADIRKRNLIPRDAFPYTTATRLTYDSGDFVTALDRALELADYTEYRHQQQSRGPRDPLIGIGVATAMKGSGGPGKVTKVSNAILRLEPSGDVLVYTEVSPHGQGTETVFAQVVADALGVTPEQVRVLHGDTDMLPEGQGTFASRGMAVGGAAVFNGARELRRRLGKVAADLLECADADVVIEDSKVFDRTDPEQAMSFAELSAAAHSGKSETPDAESAVEVSTRFTLPDNAYGFGAHVAVVEVDPETGETRILRYAAVHDCGRAMNPKLLQGQIDGAMAQGLGAAMGEAMVYTPEGQPVTGSFLDYAMPLAEDMPITVMETMETPSDTNPLGVKGIGELPTVVAPVAMANAAVDALRHLGVRHLDAPLTAEKVWRALQSAREGSGKTERAQ